MVTPADIIPLTDTCRKNINDLLKDQRQNVEVYEWLEVQQARLNLWAQSLGVFANDELSITFRLGKNQQVTKIIIQLLTALKGNLHVLRCVLEGKQPVKVKPEAKKGDDSEESSSSSSESSDDEDPIERQRGRVEDGLGRLGQVAVRLRRDGTKRTAEKAASFEPLGEGNEPLAPAFEEFIKTIIRREFDPLQPAKQPNPVSAVPSGDIPKDNEDEEPYALPEYLRVRLRQTMLARWRRIAYQRHHAEGLANKEGSKNTNLEAQRGKGKVLTAVAIEKQGRAPSKPQADASKPAQTQKSTVGRGPRTAATETDEKLVIDKKTDLLPKTAGTMTTKVRAGDLSFPPPPKVKEGTDLFMCPFCGLPQSTAILPRRKWQLHVMQDMAPYICVFEHCTEPLKAYSTSDDWLQHLKQEHSKRAWSCNACPHGQHVHFDDPDEYKNHLQARHGDATMSDQRINLLIDMGAQHSSPRFPCCLFCGFVAEVYDDPESDLAQKEVIEHMQKRHMQAFALDSMPWDIPGAEGDDDYRLTRRSHSASADQRDAIMNDEELDLQFGLDEDEERGLEHDPSLRKYLVPNTSSGGAMFEEIRKRFSPADSRDTLTKLRDTVEKWMIKNGDLIIEEALPSTGQPRRQSTLPTSEALRALGERQDDEGSDNSESSRGYKGDSAMTAMQQEIIRLCCEEDLEHLRAYLREHECRPEHFDAYDSERLSAMQWATLRKSTDKIKVLFEAGYSKVYEYAEDGLTSLAIAAMQDDTDAAQLLLDKDTDWSSYRHATPWLVACVAGSTAVAKLLLEKEHKRIHSTYYYSFSRGLAVHDEDVAWNLEKYTEYTPVGAEEDFCPRWDLLSIDCTPLTMALLYERKDIIDLLVEHGAQLQTNIKAVRRQRGQATVDEKEDSTLYETIGTLLAYEGKAASLRRAIDLGHNVYDMDSMNCDAANSAACAGNTAMLRLISEGAKSDEKWKRSMECALVRAAERNRVDCIKYILDEGIEVDCLGRSDVRGLMGAIDFDCEQAFDLFIERGADIHLKDSEGDTPLSFACQKVHPYMVERLLKLGADVEAQSPNGETALNWASRREGERATKCVSMLLAAGADIHTADADGFRPLHSAASYGNAETGKLLLAAGAEIDTRDSTGSTPLISAVDFPCYDLVVALLDAGADINAKTTDEEQMTPLGQAVQGAEDLELVKLLVERGADLEARNGEGCTALFLACKYGLTAILKHLIDKGAKMNVENDKGDTALMSTVEDNHIECLEILLDGGVAPPDEETFWKPALLRAAENGSLACLRLFLTKTKPDVTTQDDLTPLIMAVTKAHWECVQLLLDAGADVNVRDKEGKTALNWAARDNRLPILKALLDKGAQVNAKDNKDRTPLTAAVVAQNWDCAEALIDAGADVNISDSTHTSALAFAAADCKADIIKKLLTKGAVVDAANDEGRTPLQWCLGNSQHGTAQCVKLLLEAGANVNHIQDDTPVLSKAITALPEDDLKASAEHIFLLLGHPDIDINATDTQNKWSPLFRAVSAYRLDIVERFFELNVDTSPVQLGTGMNCLGYALQQRQKPHAAFMMRKGVALVPGYDGDYVKTMIQECTAMLGMDDFADLVGKVRTARTEAFRKLFQLRLDGDPLTLLPLRLRSKLFDALDRARTTLKSKRTVTFVEDKDAITGASDDDDDEEEEVSITSDELDDVSSDDEKSTHVNEGDAAKTGTKDDEEEDNSDDEPIQASRLTAASIDGLASRPKQNGDHAEGNPNAGPAGSDGASVGGDNQPQEAAHDGLDAAETVES